MGRTRESGLDFTRAIAIVLIVITHSTSILSFDSSSEWINRFLYSYSAFCGLGLFTMLAGSLQMRSNCSMSDYYRKRFTRILLPFLFWATIVYVISGLMGKYPEIQSISDAFRLYLPFLISNKINIAYWYIYLIIFLYALTPLLIFILKPERKYTFWIFLALMVAWGLCVSFVNIEGIPGTMVTYLGYYISGCFIDRYSRKRPVYVVVGAVAFVLLFVINLRTVSILFLYLCLSNVNFGSKCSFFERLSRFGYTIYLTHFIFIRCLFILFSRFFSTSVYMPLLMTFIVVVIEYLFCLSLKKCKFVPDSLVGV